MHLEVGYIGKKIANEYQSTNLDNVPINTTLGGQSFANAFGQLYSQLIFNGIPAANVAPQPFFERVLGGGGSAFCKGYASCTAAVAANYGTGTTSLVRQTAVSDLWNKMAAQSSWILPQTTYGQPYQGGAPQATSINSINSLGWGNYNAVFVTLRTNAWHGLTLNSNFTWGRALGTGVVTQASSSFTQQNAFNLAANYGVQPFDIKFIYNQNMYYEVPFFKGQRGVVGRILGGWTISPLFTAQSGNGTAVGYSEGSCSGCEAFGEVTTPGTSAVGSITEEAVGLSPYTGGGSAHYNVGGGPGNNLVFGSSAVGNKTSNGVLFGLNRFADPAAVYSQFRPCVLGLDTSCGGYYNLRGLPQWNVDVQVVKDLAIYKERMGAQFFFTFTNVLNHFQPGSASLTLTSPTSFGQITGAAGGTGPRSMEFGLRIHF